MKKSDRLYTLIKAMTAAERAFFRKHAMATSKGNQSNYIRLFDFIKKMDAYDEKRIVRHFRKETFVKNFAVSKKYLLDAVMKALRAYESGKTVKHQAAMLFEDARIYCEKEMIEDAHRMLSRAKKKAYAVEAYDLILEVIKLEIRLNGQFTQKDLNKVVQELLREEQRILEIHANLNAIRQLYYVIFEVIKKKRDLRSETDIQKVEEIIGHPIFSDIENAMSFSAKITFLTSYTFYYDLVEDYAKALECSQASVMLWESKPVMIKEDLGRYSRALVNLLNRCYRVENWDLYTNTLVRLKSIEPESLNMEVRLFERIKHFELFYADRNLDFESMQKCIPEIIDGLAKYSSLIKPNYLSIFYHNLSTAYYHMGMPKDALKWNNALLNFHKMDLQKYTVRYAMLLNLIIHYELEDFGLLDHLIRSYERDLKKQPEVSAVEIKMIEFLKRAVRNFGTRDLQDIYKHYLQAFSTLYEKPAERMFIRELHLVKWFESKVSRKKFAEVLTS